MAEMAQIPVSDTPAIKPVETPAAVRPEKYKTDEDWRKGYDELVSMVGKPKGNDVPVGDEKPPVVDANGKPVVEKNADGTDKAPAVTPPVDSPFQKYTEELTKDSKLSDASYKELADKGIPREIVDQYIAGMGATRSVQEGQAQAIITEVGGPDAYASISEWAAANVPAAELEAYNASVTGSDVAKARMAVLGLAARYEAAVGTTPARTLTGNVKPSAEVFRSVGEMQAAMADPRYKTDAAYRKEVETKCLRSNILS